MIRAIIFDFDGVILQSAGIKTDAFLELFSGFPEHQGAIKAYHLQHQGISRYNKFEWIYENLLQKPYSAGIRQDLGNRFSEIVFNKVMSAPPLPGAFELLRELKGRVKTFVASGTPDAELEAIIQQRNLAVYFTSVYGSGRSKEQIIDLIMADHDYEASELLFVGDAVTDYDAAMARDLNFVAVQSAEMAAFWERHEIRPVTNLMEILDRFNFA